MARTLRELNPGERSAILNRMHAEAETAGWHSLGNTRKAELYKKWELEFDLTHAAAKDGIMKGFDRAQHIPPSGEAAIHAVLREKLERSQIPYVQSKVRRAAWRREVDFVLGFSERFLTHIAELEPAPSWQAGLQQALLYKSLFYQETGVQALPTLILFGDVTEQRWLQIGTVCLDQRTLLLAYELLIDGRPAPGSIIDLLAGSTPTLRLE